MKEYASYTYLPRLNQHSIFTVSLLLAMHILGLKTVIEDEEDLIRHSKENKALIFAFNPHDMLPYAVFCFNPILRRLPGKIGEDGSCLMTSAIFNVPFLRHVYSWVKGFPVDKRTFLGRLHRGESFAFTPVCLGYKSSEIFIWY